MPQTHSTEAVSGPHVCHKCQRPGDLTQYEDGEWYHPGCRPDWRRGNPMTD